jgi:hypothetical protein
MAFLMLCAGAGSAEEAAKPACNAHNVGRFWPEEANSDSETAQRAGRCGELLLCTRGVWTYSWQPLTVHINQLGKDPKQPIPGCAATSTRTTGHIPQGEISSSR